MFLKTLTLKGFKSFADKSTLNLEPGITAIVGPNGSGKSNISDAVLWVLGERNAKHLRGASMEDVIFAGSSARRATAMAEVELVLDNSDGTLPIDYSDVVIARRMYRSGESEYLINGTVARRLDVLDILHDTGLGAGTHSIISQGSIDSVLQSKPEDRRGLIEEAAGVLKHKQRMARSARKLERMHAHVERISDVVGEVQRQLGPLERKAKRAKKYEELAEELAHAKLQLAVDDLRTLQKEHREVLAREEELEERTEHHRSIIETLDRETERLQQKIRTETEDVGELARKQRGAASAVERIESALALMRDRRRSALSRAGELSAAMESSKAALEKTEADLTEARAEFERIVQEKERTEGRVAELQQQVATCRAEKERQEAHQKELEAEGARLRKESANTREEIAHTQEALTNGLAHIKVLEGHRAELEFLVKRSTADAQAAQAEADSLTSAEAAMEEQEKAARALVASCVNAREETRRALDEARNTEQTIQAQIAALEEVERSHVAQSGEARAWIEEHRKRIDPASEDLSHMIKADPSVESLVELLLGSDMDAIVIDGDAIVKAISQELDVADLSGEITLVLKEDPTRKAHADHGGTVPGPSYRLLDELTYPDVFKEAVEAVLGDVIVCESLDEALRLHGADEHGHRFALADGTVVWPTGKVTLGMPMQDEDQGVLARLRHLRELKASYEEAHEASVRASTEAERAEEHLRNAQNESLDITQKLAEVRGNGQSAQRRAQQAFEKLESANRELEEANVTFEGAERIIAEAKPDLEKLTERLGELQAALVDVEEGAARTESSLAPLLQQHEQLLEELTAAKLEAAKIAERAVYGELLITRHLSDLEHMQQTAEGSRELAQVKRGSAKRLEELMGLFTVLSDAARALERMLEANAHEAQSASSGLHGQLEELRRRSQEAHGSYDGAAEALSELRIEKARMEMQVELAVSSIVEDCHTPLDHALTAPVLTDRAQVEEEAFRLNRRIASLGTINPDAANEYDELKERYDYLASQLNDLREAARSLGRINGLIETRMKEDFTRTFEEVDRNFQEIFAMLFPGGSAHLSLEDPEDMENSGVEVNAQPAGKRISKMSLMSGGEKSLTALALLFALYRTRPIPFYILDEVEAALDDTNLRRLIGYITALRDHTQLIMITHQRRTMEMADVLFGVSMQADGVTKVVSQKLERALQEAE